MPLIPLAPDLPFRITAVDTKGIEGTTQREDLMVHVEDARIDDLPNPFCRPRPCEAARRARAHPEGRPHLYSGVELQLRSAVWS